MAIENTLERIAVALETLAAGQGLVAGTTVTVTPTEEKPKRKPRKGSKASKETSEKPTEAVTESTSTSEPEKSEESSEPEVTIADVRTALTRLQNAVDGAAARKVLSTKGGNGALSKVKPAKYADVVAAANEQAAAAETQAEAEAEIDG